MFKDLSQKICQKNKNPLQYFKLNMIFVCTFRMCKHFAVSVKPTISSGEHTLMKGKSEFLANWAAKAVFPAFGGPSSSTETKP